MTPVAHDLLESPRAAASQELLDEERVTAGPLVEHARERALRCAAQRPLDQHGDVAGGEAFEGEVLDRQLAAQVGEALAERMCRCDVRFAVSTNSRGVPHDKPVECGAPSASPARRQRGLLPSAPRIRQAYDELLTRAVTCIGRLRLQPDRRLAGVIAPDTSQLLDQSRSAKTIKARTHCAGRQFLRQERGRPKQLRRGASVQV